MNTVIRNINIREALSRTLRHPLLQDINLEQVIQYVIDFIGIFGIPCTYEHRETVLHIEDFKAELPCDCITIEMVKDCRSGLSLRKMTDVYNPRHHHGHPAEGVRKHELSFKTQGRMLFCSFPCGDVAMAYLSMPVDEEGLPLLVDDPNYLLALDAYIKRETFNILFDQGKIQPAVLNQAEQRYAWAAGRMHTHFNTPSMSEMESITRMWNTLIPRVREFDRQFESLGNREHTGTYYGGGTVLELNQVTVNAAPEEKKEGDDPTIEGEVLVWDD